MVDLNTVRLETLRGAARDAATRLAAHIHTHPTWFDADDGAQWGFALGQACARLDRALRAACQHGGQPLDEYRATRAAVGSVAHWCVDEAEARMPNEPAGAAALDVAADELAAILCDADRAPSWMRERARRSRSTVAGA